VKRILIAGVGLLAVAATVTVLTRWPTINVVETGNTPEYPDLTPRVYPVSPERAFDAALHAVSRLPRWTLIAYDPGRGEIRAEARTRLFRFVDDVLVRIGTQDGGASVSARSASRVGKGDFGQNARNVRALYEELERELQKEHRR
jgi:uncharacterized protein (DUF1499 family)